MAQDKPIPNRVGQESQRTQGRIDAALRALRAVIRDTYQDQYGHLVGAGSWELEFKLRIDPSADWNVSFHPLLEEQLLAQLEQAEARSDVYIPGRAYCFRCETSTCLHAVPSSPQQIFENYDPLGSPRWRDLAQHLIDHGDERMEQLYGPRPSLLSCYVRGRDLRDQQLAAFGKASKTYALLGQIIAGYIPFARPGGEDQDALALTFQAVQIKNRQGRSRVELNTLAALPEQLALSDLLADQLAFVGRALKIATEAFQRINHKLEVRPVAEAPDLLRQVPGLLRRLGSDLERGQRQHQRQTQHARERRQIQRPVDKAMADLRLARQDRVFFDDRTKAIVLHAEKGRCHVFNEDGRHVTSFVIPMESVRQRLSRKRWLFIEKDAFARFMKAAAGQIPLELPG